MSATSNAQATGPAAAPPAQAPSGSPKRKKILLIIGLAFLLAAIAYGAYWLLFARFVEETDDAYVHGNVVLFSPLIAGTVCKFLAGGAGGGGAGRPRGGRGAAGAGGARA